MGSMRLSFHSLLLHLFHLFLIRLVCVKGDEQDQKKFYIVYLENHPVNHEYSAAQTHLNLLSSVTGSYSDAADSMVYSYTKSFNAFAAKLSTDEAENLSRMDQVLSVIPNRYHKLHTTRSWNFIGLPLNARRNLKSESDIIVGLFDTGITPESQSFKDEGFGPPPAKWKGTCGQFANFSGCNNKIIGARYFKLDATPDPADILSPVDVNGHGTHTSSTSAGNLVENASLYGLAKGTARGAVPSARVSIYKVCWASSGCNDMDILAAYDAAIHDGVDVISISIGGGGSSRYGSDSIAVGAFHAMKKGIITVASAGNDGPMLGSVINHAPWLVTVAASGIDRQFINKVHLGNGQDIIGVGVNTFNTKKTLYPLISGLDAANSSHFKVEARNCYDGYLNPKKVKGKIVLCEYWARGTESVIKKYGGVGTILQNYLILDGVPIFIASASMVNTSVGESINTYIHSTSSPSAVIFKSQEAPKGAPYVASFSSRGPNPGSEHLLKPDIAAPGIDILAAYTPLRSITGMDGDTQYSEFSLMSGTSMACPHVAGVAAYVKSFHPNWSQAAIKSAIMTTATPMSHRVNKEAEFAYGVGQVNPRKAVNPGLIYDIDEMSYIQFLCHEGYNGSSLAPLVGSKSINCSSLIPGLGYDVLNYPTMQLSLKSSKQPTVAVFRRTVTNVGPASSTYNATIRAPKGVEITVKPMSLTFSYALQKRSFQVEVKANPMNSTKMVSGSLGWKSSRYTVRSPIVVYSPGN